MILLMKAIIQRNYLTVKIFFNRPTFIESDFVPTQWSKDMLFALRIYIGLKIFIASFALFVTQLPTAEPVDPHTVKIFQAYCAFTLLYSLIQYVTSAKYNQPLKSLTFLFFALDICIITLVTYLQNYADNSMPLILYLCIGAAALILRLKLGLSLAIFAIILLFFEKILLYNNKNIEIDYNILGTQTVGILFSCYFLAILARRAQSAEIEKHKEAERSTALIDINHELVQDLDMGVIVVDNKGRIETCNPAAMTLLNTTADSHKIKFLHELDSSLFKLWRNWSARLINRHTKLRQETEDSSHETYSIDVLFSALGAKGEFSKITLFTESVLRQQAQRYSLERMGRMASAIAHEIRNPLTSITTANELLQQDSLPEASKQKSINIISRNSHRINQIIEDILTIGQSKQVDLEEFNLIEWLYDFLSDYSEMNDANYHDLIKIKAKNIDTLTIRFSKSHLKQVVSNLCNNAFSHGEVDKKHPIILRPSFQNQLTKLEIFNSGTPIEKEQAIKMFEPFYTTRGKKGGTGLGLYLCQQICELNLASITHKRYRNGNGFIIDFLNDYQ